MPAQRLLHLTSTELGVLRLTICKILADNNFKILHYLNKDDPEVHMKMCEREESSESISRQLTLDENIQISKM